MSLESKGIIKKELTLFSISEDENSLITPDLSYSILFNNYNVLNKPEEDLIEGYAEFLQSKIEERRIPTQREYS